jgi:hypothetical protein
VFFCRNNVTIDNVEARFANGTFCRSKLTEMTPREAAEKMRGATMPILRHASATGMKRTSSARQQVARKRNRVTTPPMPPAQPCSIPLVPRFSLAELGHANKALFGFAGRLAAQVRQDAERLRITAYMLKEVLAYLQAVAVRVKPTIHEDACAATCAFVNSCIRRIVIVCLNRSRRPSSPRLRWGTHCPKLTALTPAAKTMQIVQGAGAKNLRKRRTHQNRARVLQ